MKNVNIIQIDDITIQYNTVNVRILDSHKIKSVKDMIRILKIFKQKTGYKSKRSLKSWIKEWKSHNRLYNMGLLKEHTVDCDLEENEKLHRLMAYQILGI